VASPTGAEKISKRPVKKSGDPSTAHATNRPPSTILTSPIAESSRQNRSKGKGRQIDEGSDEVDVTSDDESDDAFEPAPMRLRQNRHPVPLGAPITTDGRMENLPELHRDVVHQFVAAAKKHDEKLRNKKGVHRKPYFNESEFREMAIQWTLSLNDMLESGLDEKKVISFGEHFVPLIEENHKDYEERMNRNDNRDMDSNHRNVIDLVSDDDYGDDDYYDDDNISEQPSKYFLDPKVQAFNAEVAQAEKLPQQSRDKSEAPKQAQGSYRGKGKRSAGFKKGSRRSNGSASGSGSGSRGGRRSSSGVTKRAGKSSGGSGRKNANIMTSFSKSGGGGRGGMGGSIGMMPT